MYGYLWTGAGDYRYGASPANNGQSNSSSITGGQYGVLRIPIDPNTGAPTFFPVSHETNVRLQLRPTPCFADTVAPEM